MAGQRKTFDMGCDSRTGKFIPVKEAERRPSTTTVERVPKPGFGDTKNEPPREEVTGRVEACSKSRPSFLSKSTMNEQERKIIKLLLNEMAFEGAAKHFQEAPPDVPRELFLDIERIQIPMKWCGRTESYRYAEVVFDEERSVFENCYKFLRTIRNNIIHANKAYRPDTPERLWDILDWAERFVDAVYKTKSGFSKRAEEIKCIMQIESF